MLATEECHGLLSKSKEEDERYIRSRNALLKVCAVCFVFLVAEVVGGIYSHSLGILTDAAHLLSDLTGFSISLFALWIGRRAPTLKLSYGFYRVEVLGALTTVSMIWIVTGILVYVAIERILNPVTIDGELMFILATFGATVNCINGCILFRAGHGHSHGPGGHEDHGHEHQPISHPHEHGHGHNRPGMGINVRAAFVHVVGDGIQAILVMISGAIIWYSDRLWLADALCTFTFAFVVYLTSRKVFRQCLIVLMEAAPDDLDPDLVKKSLLAVPAIAQCARADIG